MPSPLSKTNEGTSFVDVFGLRAFSLFKKKDMAIPFIFSMLLGVSLQITNGFANPFITSFASIPEYADSWGAQNANALISISQISETLCILLIPIAMKFFGIKKVMLIAMTAWVFRFGLFGAGNPGSGVLRCSFSHALSMVSAFDFFNISGSLYVNMKTDEADTFGAHRDCSCRITNGIGATIGTLGAQVKCKQVRFRIGQPVHGDLGMSTCFAAYALVVAVQLMILFKDPKKQEAA